MDAMEVDEVVETAEAPPPPQNSSRTAGVGATKAPPSAEQVAQMVQENFDPLAAWTHVAQARDQEEVRPCFTRHACMTPPS